MSDSPQTTVREDGFYWVRLDDGEVVVASWYGPPDRCWFLTGNDQSISDDDPDNPIEVLSDLLRPPGATAHG
jgi:hypothetical protein